MRNMMKRAALTAIAAGFGLATMTASASSHREALAVLNEPCADNTDTYAWVAPGAHDKLYLVASFYPLHEPGQGNQGLRACNGYRYEFHIGKDASLADKFVYRIEFTNKLAKDKATSNDDPLGSNELLWQITGGTEVFNVWRIGANGREVQIGENLPVAPNNHGPQTDRLVYGLGEFKGYETGDPTSREVGLYDDKFIADHYIHNLANGGRAFAGQRDDSYQLDEKGIFDLVNLCRDGLFGIPGARRTACEDVFTGFNVFTIALEIPTSEIFPGGIPHNGELRPDSTDSLLRVWTNISKQAVQMIEDEGVTGYRGEGPWKQVGRNALPLFDAGIVGTARQTKYLRSSPMNDVSNFGNDILYPVLVRDAEILGIYAALGIDPDAAGLKGPRLDIIRAINLGRPIPIADGYTGDVITLDAATDSHFPNGRSLIAQADKPNKLLEDVSDIIISLVVAGNPAAGAGDGVGENDRNYLRVFPFAPLPHQGLNQGHGGTNKQVEPDGPAIPVLISQ